VIDGDRGLGAILLLDSGTVPVFVNMYVCPGSKTVQNIHYMKTQQMSCIYEKGRDVPAIKKSSKECQVCTSLVKLRSGLDLYVVAAGTATGSIQAMVSVSF
jgi:hypothetical protein